MLPIKDVAQVFSYSILFPLFCFLNSIKIKKGGEQFMDELKPDSKQWIPIYGLYQTIKDIRADKPTVGDKFGLLILYSMYHSFFITLALALLLG